MVRHTTSAIAVDGRADESDWDRAPWGGEFARAEGGRPVPGSARAKLLWDQTHLYLYAEVRDRDVFSPYTERDDPLWKADVLELFVDADRNGRGYIELQVNPRGAIFDAFFPVTRAHEHHLGWSSKMRAAVQIDGTADDQGDTDRGWSVEIALPHGDVKGMDGAMAVATPPRPGDRWRLNAIRVDRPKGKGISASSWSPITIRDFHALDRMLTVVFADAEGAVPAASGAGP